MTIYLLNGFLNMEPSNQDEPLVRLFDIGRTELLIATDLMICLIDPVLNVFLTRITPNQAEPMGRFMKVLHDTINMQPDLKCIPKKMHGAEDIYFYTQKNLINLAQARLKYYRSIRLSKGQLLSLLNISEIAEAFKTDLMIMILGMVNIDKSQVNEKDLNLLGVRSKILLKGFLTIPKRFNGELCTTNIALKQTESVIWDLLDLFIPREMDAFFNDMLTLSETFIFLFRVFGLPLTNFAEVRIVINAKSIIISCSSCFNQ